MDYNIDNIKILAESGYTTRQIGDIFNKSNNTISYHLKKHNYSHLLNYGVIEYNHNFFNSIDTKEKAYIFGFLSGDGDYNKCGAMTISIKLEDRCILDFICSKINTKIRISKRLNRKTKTFPKVRCTIGSKEIISNLKKYGIFDFKENRVFKRVNENLDRYFLQGFFDAEGCITWGRRDKINRLWQKVNFTSSYNLLNGIKSMLDDYNILTDIHKKGQENCYDITFCDLDRVIKFFKIIYPDDSFIILDRKYQNWIKLKNELIKEESYVL